MSLFRTQLLLTAAALLLGWAGAAHAGPAPVTQFGANPPARNGAVTVRPGDSLPSIAKMYGVPVSELAAINGLSAPYNVSVGRRLLLPMPRTHKVGRDDTLYSLSRMYGTTVPEIARMNNIAEPYTLKMGQVLRIPRGAQGQAQPQQPRSAAEELSSLEPKKTIIYKIGKPADTTPMLRTPGPSDEHKAFDSLLSKIVGVDDAQEEEPKAQINLVTAATALPETEDAEIVGKSSRAGFIWPVRGQVISHYGPKSGGLYNDGINIAAPRGTPVKAAADGTVAYVGDRLKSYGNLVLIRHPGGMVTTYAHMHNVQVKPGTKVARGQIIGSVGSTGAVLNAQLHFEVRRGTRTLDPKEYLG